MTKKMISSNRFKSNKLLAVVAVFTLIALLLMIEAVSEVVVKAGNAAGINMPPVPIFRQAAADLFLVGLGLFLLIISPIFIVPLVKFAVIGAALAVAGYGVYQIWKLIQGKPVTGTLPQK